MAHKPLPQVLTQTPLYCIMIVFVGIISYSLDIYPRQVNQIFRKVKKCPLRYRTARGRRICFFFSSFFLRDLKHTTCSGFSKYLDPLPAPSLSVNDRVECTGITETSSFSVIFFAKSIPSGVKSNRRAEKPFSIATSCQFY